MGQFSCEEQTHKTAKHSPGVSSEWGADRHGRQAWRVSDWQSFKFVVSCCLVNDVEDVQMWEG